MSQGAETKFKSSKLKTQPGRSRSPQRGATAPVPSANSAAAPVAGVPAVTPGLPVLLPYQQRWIDDPAPVKIWEKSRRIGASWAEAADSVLYAASPTGQDVLYVGYNQDMTREFIGDCAMWARAFQIVAGEVSEFFYREEKEDRDILAFRIRFSSGHDIVALSSRPSNLRGKQGRVIIDEAAFHKELGELLKAALALLMWGGSVHILSTHNGEDNPFNELISDARAGKNPYSVHRTTLDDALAEGLYHRICLRLQKPYSAADEARWRQRMIDNYLGGADEELFCVPAYGSGVYLTRMLIESCMDEALPPVVYKQYSREYVDLPEKLRQADVLTWCEENLKPLLDAAGPNANHFLSEDFGRSGDLTAVLVTEELPGLTYKTLLAYELRNAPFKVQEQILFYVLDHLPRFRGAAMDARGNGQQMAEATRQKYGAGRVAEVMLSDRWYLENMSALKSALEEKTILLPRDADWLDDLRAFKMKNGIAKIPDGFHQKGQRGPRHADAGIAVALNVFAIRHVEGGPIEYQSVIGRRFSMTGARAHSFMRAPADDDDRGRDPWRGI